MAVSDRSPRVPDADAAPAAPAGAPAASRGVPEPARTPGPSTAAVHAGEPRAKPGNALATPIMQTATFTFANTQELCDHFEHRIEREEYGRWKPDLVTAHLCASDAIVERASRALRPGCCLGMVAFHVDQWRETGKVSRFAYDEARMEATLGRAGLTPEGVEVEREVRTFASVEEGLAAAVSLQDRWKSDGRWHRYLRYLEEGGRTLTRSHLIVMARKP